MLKEAARPPWPDIRAEQRLVSVDISHAAQQFLIEQGALDRGLAAAEKTHKTDPTQLRAVPRPAASKPWATLSRPNRLGSTNRNSRPEASLAMACVCLAISASDSQTNMRPVMPRCTIHCAFAESCGDGSSTCPLPVTLSSVEDEPLPLFPPDQTQCACLPSAPRQCACSRVSPRSRPQMTSATPVLSPAIRTQSRHHYALGESASDGLDFRKLRHASSVYDTMRRKMACQRKRQEASNELSMTG